MKHIIDSEAVEKLYTDIFDDMQWVRVADLRALISNSPQADGMVLVPSEPTEEMVKAVMQEVKYHLDLGLSVRGDIPCRDLCKAMLSAYKPQSDVNTPPEVYDIVVDTGDGIYHTAEVVHFQQSGSKRMIQVRLGEPQADDVRKDAEPSDDKLKAMRDFAMSVQLSHDYDWIDYMRDMYFIAIDKARE